MSSTPTFQEVILRLQSFWNKHGCALLQPYDMEVGAGTSHTATFLRAIGPEPLPFVSGACPQADFYQAF